MNLRSRLYLAIIAIIAVLLAPAFYAQQELSELRNIAFDLQRRHAGAYLALGRLQTALSETDRLQRSFVAAPSASARDAMYAALDRAGGELERLAGAGYEREAAGPRVHLTELERRTSLLDTMMSAGRVEAATSEVRGLRPLLADLQAELTGLAEVIDRRGTAATQRAQTISQRAAETAALSLSVAVALALLLGLLTVVALTSPLERLRDAIATVADGHFEAPEDLPYGRGDEVGDLSRSFRAMTRRLGELERLKAEFVSIASHELKTPVGVIRGYAELMEDGLYGPVTERQRDVLGRVRGQTVSLAERIGQLLALSRLEAQGLEVSPDASDLGDLLTDVRRTFEPLAARQEVRLELALDEALPERVWLDASRIQHEVLGNVLSNALKFTPVGGRVRLAAHRRAEKLLLVVSDTGRGIPEEQLPYVFEKYYRAGHDAGKVGAGLGLAIAREVVEAHGGRMWAESEAGEGTVMWVELPLVPDGEAAAARGGMRAPEPAYGPEPGSGAVPVGERGATARRT